MKTITRVDDPDEYVVKFIKAKSMELGYNPSTCPVFNEESMSGYNPVDELKAPQYTLHAYTNMTNTLHYIDHKNMAVPITYRDHICGALTEDPGVFFVEVYMFKDFTPEHREALNKRYNNSQILTRDSGLNKDINKVYTRHNFKEFGIHNGSVRIITFVSATELAKELNPRIPGVDVIVVNGRLTPNMSHPTAWLDTNHDMYKKQDSEDTGTRIGFDIVTHDPAGGNAYIWIGNEIKEIQVVYDTTIKECARITYRVGSNVIQDITIMPDKYTENGIYTSRSSAEYNGNIGTKLARELQLATHEQKMIELSAKNDVVKTNLDAKQQISRLDVFDKKQTLIANRVKIIHDVTKIVNDSSNYTKNRADKYVTDTLGIRLKMNTDILISSSKLKVEAMNLTQAKVKNASSTLGVIGSIYKLLK